MHDLTLGEDYYFQHGSWCAPQKLFRPTNDVEYKVLKEKCLLDEPNACPGDHNPLAAIFWVAYTCIITHTIMQLVVAVILEGYEEGNQKGDSDNIDLCVRNWKQYDPDLKLSVSLPVALNFIKKTIEDLENRDKKRRSYDNLGSVCGKSVSEMTKLKMREIRPKCGGMTIVLSDDGSKEELVTFYAASRQILRHTVLEGDMTDEALKEIDTCDNKLNKSEKDRMGALERKCSDLPGGFKGGDPINFTESIAAIKLQRAFKGSSKFHPRMSAPAAACRQSQESPAPEVICEEDAQVVRAQTRQMSAEPSGILPPRAG